MNLFKLLLRYLTVGPQLGFWPTVIMAGAALAQGAMASQSAGKISRQQSRAARAQYRTNLKSIELMEKDAARNRKLADYNVQLLDIQAEDALYRSKLNEAILANDKDKLLKLFQVGAEETEEEFSKARAMVETTLAANGVDLNSVTGQALMLDMSIKKNKEVAKMVFERRDKEASLLFDQAMTMYEADQNEWMAKIQKAFMLDDAEYTFALSKEEATLARETSAAERDAGIISAKATKAKGNQALFGSMLDAGMATFGNKEFRAEFGAKFPKKDNVNG